MEATCTSYKETGYFSSTVIDYLEDLPALQSFYGHRPTLKGFAELLEHKQVKADRRLLADVLTHQYAHITNKSLATVQQNIELLRADNTYTVTTGHQLNIFTGPLYFIYKIVTAIKLCQQLKAAFPDKEFVPVYWMASEDHDFAEINYTHIGGKKVHWWYEASGATGRINPDTMRQAVNQYKGVLGIGGHADELASMVETAYTTFDKLADATRYLVHSLFGHHGLVIIDADDKQLKQHFAPIITKDIIGQYSYKNITATNIQLQQLGVHIQVNPREINFFYLKDSLRERIVFEHNQYQVLNTDISFSEAELREEVQNYPERFSPNVVMRPLYQENILPNIAYIGGGAEVVYWMELKSNFDYYQTDFPILILRNSALLVPKTAAAKISSMQLSTAELFKPADEIKNNWVKKHSEHELNLSSEWQAMESIFEQIKQQANQIDGTLVPSTAAVQARLQHAITNLEKKLVKAEKKNYHTRLQQINQLKTELFPKNSLQERTENFGLAYVKWGRFFIDELIRVFEPLDFEFTVLSE